MEKHRIHIEPQDKIDFQPIIDFQIAFLLFLDFDGVLHGLTGAVFTEKLRLEKILREFPEVYVVFSTSWRHRCSIEKLANYFAEDLRHRFIGKTPYIESPWPPYVKYGRYQECMKWMEDRKYTGKYAMLDDQERLYPPNAERLILTNELTGLADDTELKLRNILQT